jgi:hypothetical protein
MDAFHRRAVLGTGVLGTFAASLLSANDQQASSVETIIGHYSVTAFGAVGDGITDDTPAFQKAIDAATVAGGGIVQVPRGKFRIHGGLKVGPNVTIEGLFRAPTARSQGYCSSIFATGSKGDETGPPLFFLEANAGLKGLTIFYPDQDASSPVTYPWCIRGQGDNVSIQDLLLVNPWNAIDFGTHPCGRHLVRGVHGQPLNVGLFIDQCLDCGRVEDVHFWPFWLSEPIKHTLKTGTAFRMARTDWQMVTNCFCLGYQTGFLFTAIRNDAGNAMIVNSGTDLCAVGVCVDYSQVHAGLLFTNCQINAGVQVGSGSLGPIKFMNCGLFGLGTLGLPLLQEGDSQSSFVMNRGQGRMTFIGCHFYFPEGPFVPKDSVPVDCFAIDSEGNGLTIMGCDFTGLTARHVRLGPKSKSTLITSTRFINEPEIDNQSSGKFVLESNVSE